MRSANFIGMFNALESKLKAGVIETVDGARSSRGSVAETATYSTI
jgi:hypothetical protein